MSKDFYLLYNKDSLRVLAISGSTIADTDLSNGIIKVKEQDAIPFMNGVDDLGKWSIDVSGEYVSFYKKISSYRNMRQFVDKKDISLSTHHINDLNYQLFFFDYFRILTKVTDKGLELEFDLENIGSEKASQFNLAVTEKTGRSKIFVSKLGDSSALVASNDFDLNDFKKFNKVNLDIALPEGQFSFWAARFL